ncbi:serine hydrolase domain-containing protein [Planktotalea sp.]|uniref:serine hydrolase domain-containing protein n=1 Tax=Planktotalea sp. TaxID=2029877 RepID=UPI0035C82422
MVYKKVIFLMMVGGAFAIGQALALGVKIGPSKPVFLAQDHSDFKPLPVVQTSRRKDVVAFDAFETAWREWMGIYGVTASSIAIGQDGSILRSRGAKRAPSTSFPMASLSKSITAHCLNTFLEDSPYDWSSTLADLQPVLAKLNLTPGDAMLEKTLTEFATHTSGLPTRLVQGKTSLQNKHLDSQASMTRTALKVPANFNAESEYSYSNANYAILGSLIGAMSGGSYAEVCKARIMDPAKALNANVSGHMAKTAGYGGWLVSVEDYARYAMHWFAPNTPWVKEPRDFALDPETGYGMGALVRNHDRGYLFSHGGSWKHPDRRRANLGSYMMVGPDGTAVVVSWDTKLPPEAYRHLHRAFAEHL